MMVLFSALVAQTMQEVWHSGYLVKVSALFVGITFGTLGALGLGKTIDAIKPGTVIAVVLLLGWFSVSILVATFITRWLFL